jgi:hypothetical protein
MVNGFKTQRTTHGQEDLHSSRLQLLDALLQACETVVTSAMKN